ncbi:hypothetical protein JCM11251_005383 [Rhodosporidiobolus azoricus]
MPPRRPPPKKPAASSAAAPPPANLPEGAPKPGHNRYLPPHEAELFRQVLTLYENKQNKKGLETVAQILDKFPDHGESLCMQGIFHHSLGRKEQGYELVQRGAKNDSGSHIVWHVYALMRRADKQFEEALDCYRKAVSIEKDSLNLLNDLSTLTIHLRHYPQYVSVRRSILRTQPRLRKNWLALAVAQFLASQFSEAATTLTYYENMLREVPKGDVEMGEVLLFHAKVLEEAGESEKCLEFLSEKSAQITDRSAYATQRARLLLDLNRTESAIWAWETLLGENPDSREYITSMVRAKGGDCDDKSAEGRKKALSILDELAEKYPTSNGIKRLTLDIATGDDFVSRLTPYLLTSLRKGIPSLFADIKALYKLPDGEGAEKAKAVGDVVERFRKDLEAKGAVVTADEGDDDSVDSPSTYLWTLYFLASHHSHPLNPSSSQSLALSTLSIASTHTPSLPELLILRARILKRSGDPVGAATAMEEARELDGQDRFLNSKAAKYAIRKGDCAGAEKTVGLFTKKDAPSPLEDLVEMQCLWFLQEEGDAYVAKEDWGRALKRYHQIYDIFQEIEEDQYDFHAYCMRKQTLNAYIELLRFENRLRDHPHYARAASSAIKIYLAMHHSPASFPEAPKENGTAVNGDAAEKEKKEREEKEKKEAEEKEKKEEEEKAAAAAQASSSGKKDKRGKGKKGTAATPASAAAASSADKDKKKDDDDEEPPAALNVYTDSDPTGFSLLNTGRSSPLDQATLFLTHLEKVRPADVRTWTLAAEVAIRQGGARLVKALQALKTATTIEESSAEIAPLVVRFKLAVDGVKDVNPAVLAVLQDGAKGLLGGEEVDLSRWVDEQLQKFGAGKEGKEEWLLCAAEAKKLAGAGQEEVTALVGQLVKREDLRPTIEHLTRALTFLRSLSSSEVESFRSSAASIYPLARAFKTSDELAALDAEAPEAAEEEKEVLQI